MVPPECAYSLHARLPLVIQARIQRSLCEARVGRKTFVMPNFGDSQIACPPASQGACAKSADLKDRHLEQWSIWPREGAQCRVLFSI